MGPEQDRDDEQDNTPNGYLQFGRAISRHAVAFDVPIGGASTDEYKVILQIRFPAVESWGKLSENMSTITVGK